MNKTIAWLETRHTRVVERHARALKRWRGTRPCRIITWPCGVDRSDSLISHARVLRHGRVEKPHGRVAVWPTSTWVTNCWIKRFFVILTYTWSFLGVTSSLDIIYFGYYVWGWEFCFELKPTNLNMPYFIPVISRYDPFVLHWPIFDSWSMFDGNHIVICKAYFIKIFFEGLTNPPERILKFFQLLI